MKYPISIIHAHWQASRQGKKTKDKRITIELLRGRATFDIEGF
jgi:hypothetical protein